MEDSTSYIDISKSLLIALWNLSMCLFLFPCLVVRLRHQTNGPQFAEAIVEIHFRDYIDGLYFDSLKMLRKGWIDKISFGFANRLKKRKSIWEPMMTQFTVEYIRH